MINKKNPLNIKGAVSVILILGVLFVGLLGYIIFELVNIDPSVTPTQQIGKEVSAEEVPEIQAEEDLDVVDELLEQLDLEADNEHDQIDEELNRF